MRTVADILGSLAEEIEAARISPISPAPQDVGEMQASGKYDFSLISLISPDPKDNSGSASGAMADAACAPARKDIPPTDKGNEGNRGNPSKANVLHFPSEDKEKGNRGNFGPEVRLPAQLRRLPPPHPAFTRRGGALSLDELRTVRRDALGALYPFPVEPTPADWSRLYDCVFDLALALVIDRPYANAAALGACAAHARENGMQESELTKLLRDLDSRWLASSKSEPRPAFG